MNDINKTTIGSDIEFSLTDQHWGLIIDARQFIRTEDHSNHIGLDGHVSLVELRPHYTSNPIEHNKNIKRLLADFFDYPVSSIITRSAIARSPLIGDEKYETIYNHPSKCCWAAGAITKRYMHNLERGDPIGGHIHFSHPSIIGLNISKLWPFGIVLDSIFVPLMYMVENALEVEYRTFSHTHYYGIERYGQSFAKNMGLSIQVKNWGFEYKTYPSFLHSEEYSKAILCLAYIIVNELIINYNNISKFSDIILSEKDTELINILWDDNFKSSALQKKRWFETKKELIIKVIKSLSLYKEYKKEIKFIIDLLNKNKEASTFHPITKTKDFKYHWLKDKKAKLVELDQYPECLLRELQPFFNSLWNTVEYDKKKMKELKSTFLEDQFKKIIDVLTPLKKLKFDYEIQFVKTMSSRYSIRSVMPEKINIDEFYNTYNNIGNNIFKLRLSTMEINRNNTENKCTITLIGPNEPNTSYSKLLGHNNQSHGIHSIIATILTLENSIDLFRRYYQDQFFIR